MKNNISFEVFAKVSDGLCSVNERDEKQKWVWATQEEAVAVAKGKKKTFPHMDFKVIRETCVGYSTRGEREMIFDTSENI